MRALNLIKQDLKRNRIELETEIEENLPLVSINYNQIIEILLNIMINAIDAMEDGGTLSVRVKRQADSEDGNSYLQIEIKDTGKGIHPEEIERVFTRYYTTKSTGTGLGLAVVDRIIKAHNGHIKVSSKVGKGSTFTISLPI